MQNEVYFIQNFLVSKNNKLSYEAMQTKLNAGVQNSNYNISYENFYQVSLSLTLAQFQQNFNSLNTTYYNAIWISDYIATGEAIFVIDNVEYKSNKIVKVNFVLDSFYAFINLFKETSSPTDIIYFNQKHMNRIANYTYDSTTSSGSYNTSQNNAPYLFRISPKIDPFLKLVNNNYFGITTSSTSVSVNVINSAGNPTTITAQDVINNFNWSNIFGLPSGNELYLWAASPISAKSQGIILGTQNQPFVYTPIANLSASITNQNFTSASGQVINVLTMNQAQQLGSALIGIYALPFGIHHFNNQYAVNGLKKTVEPGATTSLASNVITFGLYNTFNLSNVNLTSVSLLQNYLNNLIPIPITSSNTWAPNTYQNEIGFFAYTNKLSINNAKGEMNFNISDLSFTNSLNITNLLSNIQIVFDTPNFYIKQKQLLSSNINLLDFYYYNQKFLNNSQWLNTQLANQSLSLEIGMETASISNNWTNYLQNHTSQYQLNKNLNSIQIAQDTVNAAYDIGSAPIEAATGADPFTTGESISSAISTVQKGINYGFDISKDVLNRNYLFKGLRNDNERVSTVKALNSESIAINNGTNLVLKNTLPTQYNLNMMFRILASEGYIVENYFAWNTWNNRTYFNFVKVNNIIQWALISNYFYALEQKMWNEFNEILNQGVRIWNNAYLNQTTYTKYDLEDGLIALNVELQSLEESFN